VIEKRWHWFDFVLIAIRMVWFASRLMELKSQPEVLYHWSQAAVFGYIFLDVLLISIAFAIPLIVFAIKKVSPSFMIIVELICSGGVFLYSASNLNTGLVFFFVPIFTIGYLSSRWTIAWSLPSVIALFIVKSVVENSFTQLLQGMLFDVALLFFLGYCFGTMKSSFIKMKVMHDLIGQQNQTMQHSARQIERLTLYEERNRLSRELHDTVGHTLTTTIMGMNAARLLIDSSPQEAKNNLRELVNITRLGLDDIRKHIHQIAPDKEDRPLSAVLSEVADGFSINSGTKVYVQIEGGEIAVSENIRLALVRCLQESLTNAKRHGLADTIHVTILFLSDSLSMKISDNGKGTDQLVQGFGLQAMSDRMANVNGTLQVKSSKTAGTTVHCVVPLYGRNLQKIYGSGG
jgi:signal transduction histidine kinase